MKPPLNRRSLFAQRLDRIAFASFFLGAIVPLAALAWVVQRHELQGEGAFAWLGFLVSVATLSLGAYLALRRSTRDSLIRMERDQARLAGLLAASEELSSLPDRHAAAEALVRHAGRIAKAQAALLVERGEAGEWTVASAAGFSEPEAVLDEPLCETIDRVTAADGPSEALAGGGLLVAAVRPDTGEASALVVLPAPGDAFTAPSRHALSTLGSLGAVSLSNADLRHAERNFFPHVTEILTMAVDAHLGYQRGHGRRVAETCNRVGHAMDLPAERLQALHFASLLHDIGMLRMDRDLGLSSADWQPHARHGFELLKNIRNWEASAPIVLAHHERWDGTGYPDGLEAGSIPLEARILTVCDAFDSMTCASSYRESRSPAEALAELEACAGSQFDPAVVRCLKQLAESGALGADFDPERELALQD